MADPRRPALLVLEDGTSFRGFSVGAPGETACELVFNTAMSGYQEILSDPSYCGQGVVMTYPQIGNTGVNTDDDESTRCWASAFIMRQLSPVVSNWRATQDLGSYLEQQGIPAIDGIDTRALSLRLREYGALRAILSTECLEVETLAEKARAHPSLDGQDLAQVVSCKASYSWNEGRSRTFYDSAEPIRPEDTEARARLVCFDFGLKRNILRSLWDCGFEPTVVPAQATAEDVLAHRPQALFLSNGPGDPAAVTYAHQTVRALVERRLPTLGICLGHQILAHVFGGRTHKMKFGHHGANHPVIERATGRVDITSQNHSFAVDAQSLAGTGLELTHVNGNDQSVEGMRHCELPVFSVQYHPEAAPGPHDSGHLFRRFRDLVRDHQSETARGVELAS